MGQVRNANHRKTGPGRVVPGINSPRRTRRDDKRIAVDFGISKIFRQYARRYGSGVDSAVQIMKQRGDL
jgi:hypothetical protein